MVGGIETPSSDIAIVDFKTSRREPDRRLINHDAEATQWVSLANVIDNVAFGLEMAGLPAPNGMRAPAHARDRRSTGFDLHLPRALSGGMRHVALARALIMERPILPMNEPFAALTRRPRS